MKTIQDFLDDERDFYNRIQRIFDSAMDAKLAENWNLAVELLSSIFDEGQCFPHFMANYGYVLANVNRLAEAKSMFTKAVEMAPRSEAVSLGLFHVLLDMHDEQGAVAEGERFLSIKESLEYRETVDAIKRTWE